MTIFLLFIFPLLFLVGMSYGTAILIQKIDESLERDLVNQEIETEKIHEVERVHVSV